jgi:phospholipid transport system substrate-binding protein
MRLRGGALQRRRGRFMTSKLVVVLCAMLSLSVAGRSPAAAAADPAVAPVQTLSDALLQSMRAGATLSIAERYRQLEPVIAQVFDLPLVTRLAVGPAWTSFTPDQQKDLIAAFTRYTVANYASNFHSFDGQKFEIDDNVLTRGAQKIVRTRITSPHDSPANLLYLMREADGGWRIVDVYSDGVSSLALRRSDFASAIAKGGAPELLAYLNRANDGLMKSK